VSSDAVVALTEGTESSEAGPADPPRNRRQEETFRKVLTAAVATLRESSYADLTVRAVAARAKVAPATAYTYFSSKNHLIAEVYLDLMRQVPYFTDVNEPMPRRVEKALRSLALAVADEPELAAACTTALLASGDPTTHKVRDRIGADIKTVSKDPLVAERLASTAQLNIPGDAAEFAQSIEEQVQQLAASAKLLGMKPKQ